MGAQVHFISHLLPVARRECPVPISGLRHKFSWLLAPLACAVFALAVAVTLDHFRIASSAKSLSGPQSNKAQLMLSLVTNGVLPGQNLPSALAARVGKKLVPGERAPDFSLPAISEPREVSLAQFRGKPVVLVFGSL